MKGDKCTHIAWVLPCLTLFCSCDNPLDIVRLSEFRREHYYILSGFLVTNTVFIVMLTMAFRRYLRERRRGRIFAETIAAGQRTTDVDRQTEFKRYLSDLNYPMRDGLYVFIPLDVQTKYTILLIDFANAHLDREGVTFVLTGAWEFDRLPVFAAGNVVKDVAESLKKPEKQMGDLEVLRVVGGVLVPYRGMVLAENVKTFLIWLQQYLDSITQQKI